MEQLLAAGIDVNSWDSEGSKNTPLHWAACYGNKEVVGCLLGIVFKPTFWDNHVRRAFLNFFSRKL